jgi:hypothetical protein
MVATAAREVMVPEVAMEMEEQAEQEQVETALPVAMV